MRQLSLILTVVVFATATALGQITITRSDVEKRMITSTTENFTANVATQVYVGSEGKGVAVDFSSYAYTPQTALSENVSPSSTPYGSNFSSATHAFKSSSTNGDSYVYLRLADNGLFLLGMGLMYSGNPVVLQYVPENPELKLPLTYDLKWEYDGQPVSIIEGISAQTRYKKEVDASGSLTLPIGTYNYLRIKTEEYTTSIVSFGGTVLSESVTKSLSYEYVTKEGVTCTVDADSSDSNTSNPLVEAIHYSRISSSTGSEPLASPEGLTLGTAWPNPVLAGKNANFVLTSTTAGSVNFRVVDVLGREVMPRTRMDIAPGSRTLFVNTSALPAGRYLVELTSGTGRVTQPMVVR